jgi:thiol-disulfide isomerase/thioredoxin
MKRLKITLLACSIGMALLLAGCGDGGNGAPEGPAAGGGATPTPAADPPATIPDKPADPAAKAKDAPSPKSIPEAAPGGDKSSPAEKGKKKEIPEAAKKPAAKKPAAKKPADKKPAAKKPAAKKPAAKKPAAKKPAAKKPAAKKPADKKPADKKPAGKKPAGKKDASPPTVDSQMRALLQLANQGEFAKSLEQIEAVLARKDLDKVEKQKRRAIPFFASQIAQALGRQLASDEDTAPAHAAYLTSAKHFRHLQENFKPLFPQEAGFGSTVFYNEACALASKDVKKARASLVAAVELGFNEFKLLKTDKDLDPLRKAGGFDKFVAQQEAVGAKKADEAIGKEMANNKTFPFDFTLPDLDGKPVSLSSFQGKVVIVDVWGTWCPPCRAEVPHFVELQKTYGKQGLQIVGINYERSTDPIPGIKSFAKEHGINYPLVIGNEATQNKIPEFQAFPTTLFIDRKGEVRLMAVGARPQSYLEAVVKRLLSEPAPAGAKKAAKKKPAAKKAKARKKKK